jgi:hypothetical protein
VDFPLGKAIFQINDKPQIQGTNGDIRRLSLSEPGKLMPTVGVMI